MHSPLSVTILNLEVGCFLPKHMHEPRPETPGLCSRNAPGAARQGGPSRAPRLLAAGSVLFGVPAAFCLFHVHLLACQKSQSKDMALRSRPPTLLPSDNHQSPEFSPCLIDPNGEKFPDDAMPCCG